jgi:protein phosphatase
MSFVVPELCLVVLIGASGSGKSTFARQHFRPTEILSSDFFRGLVSDDENDQSASKDAFEALHFVAEKRLAAGKLTVVDATNVQPEARRPLVALARAHDVLPVAIVLNLSEALCHERNRERPERQFGPHVVRQQNQQLRRSLRGLQREGFRYIYVIATPEEVDAATFERQPLWTNRRAEHGPFDIIGDVHGCFDELVALLRELGYGVSAEVDAGGERRLGVAAPEGRKAIFLGDLVDRGPNTPDVLRLVMTMVQSNSGLCVPGNHDTKLLRKLRGRDVQITHGLAESLEQLDKESPSFKDEVATFIDGLISHYVLDDGRLVVAHAGMKAAFQGRSSARVRDFALFGETTGETDEFGLPVRYNWASEYRGNSMVVYGHTPVAEPEWLNRTINIDTGCVFGGRLTALRYPEKELVSVPAGRTYYEPARPFLPADVSASSVKPTESARDLPDLDDVLGKRIISTRLAHNVTVREENASAALEVISRFAVDPRWLIYLPPTMSPPETTLRDGLLEHPDEAFAHYRSVGVGSVVCEQKHMGSRAVVVVCRDGDTAHRRFGVDGGDMGACFTRTGRRFFADLGLERQFLGRITSALDRSGYWEKFKTDWFCFDCELMPWSVKAQELLIKQYASVGTAARTALDESVTALKQTTDRGIDVADLLHRFQQKEAMANEYVRAYRHYCWPVNSLDDLKLAPFHLLATEGAVHVGKDHEWHMETLADLCAVDDSLLLATPYKVVDVTDTASEASATQWWEDLTRSAGEGMVVKPRDFVVRGKRGLVQPAIKVRGREYLRIIYGPEYTAPGNLERLRARAVASKRSLAVREFALGVEGLERFVRREPFWRVHECAFAVLALESEPVDPRL